MYIAQLLWTALVAVVLGVVALQQTSSATATPEAVLTGNPLIRESIRDQRTPAFTPDLSPSNVPAQ